MMTKQQKSLVRWTKQEWTTPSGKKSQDTGEVYAPKRTISKLLSTKKGRLKLAEANRKKRKGMKEGKQYVSHGLHKGKKRQNGGILSFQEGQSIPESLLKAKRDFSNPFSRTSPLTDKEKQMLSNQKQYTNKSDNPIQRMASGRVESTESPIDFIVGTVGTAGLKTANALLRPVFIRGSKPVAQILSKELATKTTPIKGAYKFLEETVDSSGKLFKPGDVVEELSEEIKVNPIKYLMKKDAIKKALEETGDESVILVTKNPLFKRTGDKVYGDLSDLARTYGGASQKAGEVAHSYTNVNMGEIKPSINNLISNMKQRGKYSASLIFKKKGGLLFDNGGLLEGAQRHLSGVEQKMYSSALKSGNKKVIKYFEDKISKGLLRDNEERQREIEKLAEKQGEEFAYRQKLERRAQNTETSPFGMSNRQLQQSVLLPRQKNTQEDLGNINVLNTESKLNRAIENRELTNFLVDIIPGIGDIKGIYESLMDGNKTGMALAALGLIPGGDIAKTFKPIIKKYNSNTEMFIDFLRQAEEQGIKVNRDSKLYKQIQDEIPAAKQYYLPKNVNELEAIPGKDVLIVKNDDLETIGRIMVDKDGYIGFTTLDDKFRNQRLGDKLYGTVNDYLQFKYGKNLKQNPHQVGTDNVTENAKKLWQRQYEKGIADEETVEVGNNIVKYKSYKPLSDEQIADALYLSHLTEQAQEGLKDSKVKNLVYHNTNEKFDEFRKDKIGSRTRELRDGKELEDNDLGFFTYENSSYKPQMENMFGKNTMPLFLSSKKPFINKVFGEEGHIIPNVNSKKFIEDLKKEYDSTISHDENPSIFFKTVGVNTVFEPTQLKSLFREHLAKWDWNNPNIHRGIVGLGAAKVINDNKERNYKKGGRLNQGNTPMEFVLKKNSTVRDHTLDGYKIHNGKLKRDNKSSVKGYLKKLDTSKLDKLKQYGSNLYSKLQYGNDLDILWIPNRVLKFNNDGDIDEQETIKNIYRFVTDSNDDISEDFEEYLQDNYKDLVNRLSRFDYDAETTKDLLTNKKFASDLKRVKNIYHEFTNTKPKESIVLNPKSKNIDLKLQNNLYTSNTNKLPFKVYFGNTEFKKGGLLKELSCNKPKRTPNHKTKSHVVKACEGNKEKIIRFGQQGIVGSPKRKNESEAYRKRRESFKARHAKNIAKGKMSAAYWADKVKW